MRLRDGTAKRLEGARRQGPPPPHSRPRQVLARPRRRGRIVAVEGMDRSRFGRPRVPNRIEAQVVFVEPSDQPDRQHADQNGYPHRFLLAKPSRDSQCGYYVYVLGGESRVLFHFYTFNATISPRGAKKWILWVPGGG